MMDLSYAAAPKSDQLNADDLIGGPRVLRITQVRELQGDQPVAIDYEGSEGRPYKPGKSMLRVMIAMWGPDGSKWPGQAIEVYRDPSIRFGPDAVGGIRISKATGISKPLDLLLTVKRGKRTPYKVQPLVLEQATEPARPVYPDDKFLDELPKMQAAIQSGKSTVDQVVKHLEKTGTVTPEQRALLTAEPDATDDDEKF